MFFFLDHVMNCSSRLAPGSYIETAKLRAYKELQFCQALSTEKYKRYINISLFFYYFIIKYLETA